MQRRHPLRRHGRALARRPRSPSAPPGPHPAARRGLRARTGCSRCACAPPRRRTAGYPVIRSEARSARCRPSHYSLAARSITMHTCTAAPPPPLMLSSRLPGAVAGNCSTPGITQRSPCHSTPRRTPNAAFTIRFADDQELDWEAGPDLRPRKHPIRDSGSRLAARSLPCGIRGHHMRSVSTVRSTAG
jgi:hypothetical protein